MKQRDARSRGSDALRSLLRRPADPEYLAAWQRSLKRAVYGELEGRDRAAVLFRLGNQWLALGPDELAEVHPWVPVRRVPGRTNTILRGLVSLRGQLHLCADLHALLGVAFEAPQGLPGRAPRGAQARLLVVGPESDRWTFEVDEVCGVESYASRDMLPPQSTVAKALVHITDGVIPLGGRLAAHIAPDRLLDSLRRSLEP